MRNLKKVLSLALAMVMLLGMMVVGAGAATEFKDVSDIPENRAAAAAVASTIEVLVGDENGNFNPNGTLTRAEAAVVLARLDLGADAAKALVATNAASFDDVADGSGYGWAKAYIDYCAGNGYIVGDGNGKFNPGAKVSSVQFGLMVSRVLGYDTKNEKIDGASDWIVKGAALARKAGLATDLAVANTDMSRADMAQMVLNALTAPMVEYTGLNISGDGFNVSSPASVRTHANDAGSGLDYKGDAIVPNITPIRLCEEKFPNLTLSQQDELDKFGRRCSVWKYKNLKIAGSEGTIVPDLAYCTKVTKDTVADWAKMEDLYAATDRNGRITMQLWINGQRMYDLNQPQDSKGNKYAVGTDDWIGWYTDAGREVEVYMNKDNLRMVERVVVVDTVLGEVTKENSDETISVKLMKTPDNKVTTGAVTLNTTVGYGDVKKGDIVLVQGYYNSSTSPQWRLNKDTTITSVEVAPIVTGFATYKYYKSEDVASYITVDGTKYYDAYSIVDGFTVQDFDLNDEKFDCTLYLDNHENIMKAVEGKDPNAVADNLIAVKRIYSTLNSGEIVNMVEGVISNGNTVKWPVKNTLTNAYDNKICTWTKDSNDVYSLSLLAADRELASGANKDGYVADAKTDNETVFKSNDVFGKAQANTLLYSDTVKFIFVYEGDSTKGIEGSVTVANGRQNYTLEAGSIIAQAILDGEITAVFINADPDVINIDEIVYVHSTFNEYDEVITRDDGTQVLYYGYTAYNAKGEAIEPFRGTTRSMADSFHRDNRNADGAYRPTVKGSSKMINEHTVVDGKVTKANGLTGDAFTLTDWDTGAKYDVMGSASTKVVDLSGTKRNIDTVSELNGVVNDGYNVYVAMIYNSSDTPDKSNNGTDTVKAAMTIFITEIVKPADDKHPITPGTPDIPEKDQVDVTVKFDAGVKSVKVGATTLTETDMSVKVAKDTDTTMTITLNSGMAVKSVTPAASVKKVNDTEYTINVSAATTVEITTETAPTGGKFTINSNTDSKPTGEITWTATTLSGKTYLTLNLTKAPEFVSEANGTTLSGVVELFQGSNMLAGNLYDDAGMDGTDRISSTNKVTFTYNATKKSWNTVTLYSSEAVDGATLTLGEDAGNTFVASAVKVNFADDPDNKVALKDLASLTGTAKDITSTSSGVEFDGTAGKIGINATYGANEIAVTKVEGATVLAGTVGAANYVGDTDGSVKNAATSMKLQANGDNYVTITLTTNKTSLVQKFDVTVDGKTTAYTKTLTELGVTGLPAGSNGGGVTLTVTGQAAAVEKGKNAEYTVTITQTTASTDFRVDGYKVTYTVNDGSPVTMAMDFKGTDTASFDVIEKVDGAVDLKITAVEAMLHGYIYATTETTVISADGKSLEVTYTGDLSAATVDKTAVEVGTVTSGTFTKDPTKTGYVDKVAVSGNKLIITFTTGMDANDVIKLNNVVKASDSGEFAKECWVFVKADGAGGDVTIDKVENEH